VSGPDIDRVVTATARSSPQQPAGAEDRNAVAVRNEPLVGVTIVAVAAGRGGPAATRSDIGARIAVDVAATRAEAVVAANAPDAGALADVGDVLATRIVEQWQAQVRLHLAARPFTDDEVEHVEGGADDDTFPLRAYDATLLLTIVIPQAVLALQIGNGDVVVRGTSGEILHPVAGPTTAGADRVSVGLAGAPEDVERAVVDRASGDVAMVALATKGLANALDDPAGLANFVSELAGEADARGIDSVEEQLPRRLTELAGAGGEEVTVALLFPAAYVPAAVPPSADTIVNLPIPVVGATAAIGATATSTQLPVATGSAASGRRRWILGAAIAGTGLLAVGLALALTHEGGSPAPASPVPPAPTTTPPNTSVATTVTTLSPDTATTVPATTTPSTLPPTTAHVIVTTPTTRPPKPATTSTTRPKATTTTVTTTTTVPVTSST
jgi:hypothetical protein